MAQTWQKKFCCFFLFETPYLCKKTQTKTKKNKLCPAWSEKEGVPREEHRRRYLCRGISHKPYHWHTLEYTPFLLFYMGWSSQIRQHRCSCSVTCPCCTWAHTGGNRQPQPIIWILLKDDSKVILTAKLSALESAGWKCPANNLYFSTKSAINKKQSNTIASSHPAWLKAH